VEVGRRSGEPVKAAWGRNSLGLLSIGLAAASVAAYVILIWTGGRLDFLGKLGALFGFSFQLGTLASLVVGVAAVARARRTSHGLPVAITGVVVGGVLTLLWVAWFGMLMLNPGAFG